MSRDILPLSEKCALRDNSCLKSLGVKSRRSPPASEVAWIKRAASPLSYAAGFAVVAIVLFQTAPPYAPCLAERGEASTTVSSRWLCGLDNDSEVRVASDGGRIWIETRWGDKNKAVQIAEVLVDEGLGDIIDIDAIHWGEGIIVVMRRESADKSLASAYSFPIKIGMYRAALKTHKISVLASFITTTPSNYKTLAIYEPEGRGNLVIVLGIVDIDEPSDTLLAARIKDGVVCYASCAGTVGRDRYGISRINGIVNPEDNE